jgi:ribosomal protein L29
MMLMDTERITELKAEIANFRAIHAEQCRDMAKMDAELDHLKRSRAVLRAQVAMSLLASRRNQRICRPHKMNLAWAHRKGEVWAFRKVVKLLKTTWIQ